MGQNGKGVLSSVWACAWCSRLEHSYVNNTIAQDNECFDSMDSSWLTSDNSKSFGDLSLSPATSIGLDYLSSLAVPPHIPAQPTNTLTSGSVSLPQATSQVALSLSTQAHQPFSPSYAYHTWSISTLSPVPSPSPLHFVSQVPTQTSFSSSLLTSALGPNYLSQN